MMEQIDTGNGPLIVTADLRVTNLNIKSFTYKGKGEEIDVEGEALEMRASGFWKEETGSDAFPISLHATVYPGHGVIPAIGDEITITVCRK